MNAYSATWFEIFGDSVDDRQTERELAFLRRQLPLPEFSRVLDVCCGGGRHADGLASAGHRVVAIDVSERALESATARLGDRARVLRHDMREIETLANAPFDAVLSLWQSFGYFDSETNVDVLRQIGVILRPGGRLVLDLYHRDFFASRLDVREHSSGGRRIVESKSMHSNRLRINLDYGDGSDQFEWEVYRPAEITRLATKLGFTCLLSCSAFDEGTPPSDQRPRAQYVFERT